MIYIAPSLLAADPLNLEIEARKVASSGADWLHVDVMDGHFVPNLTFGPHMVEALAKLKILPLDVHLMTTSLEVHVPAFAKAGSDRLIIHPEATFHPYRVLQQIQDLGCKAGIALNPGTPIDLVEPLLPHIDLILVMTVNPGFGGQSFLPDQLSKIQDLKKLTQGWKGIIEVDGGITKETAPLVIKAGADALVAGTAVFRSGDYQKAISELRGGQ